MAGLRRTKKRTRRISNATAQTTLFEDDEKELQRQVQATGKTRAEVLRGWAAAAIRSEKLRAVGKVEALSDVINAQKTVVNASQAPLISAVSEQKQFVESALR